MCFETPPAPAGTASDVENDVSYLLGAVSNIETELESQFGDDGISASHEDLAAIKLDIRNLNALGNIAVRALRRFLSDPGNPHSAAEAALAILSGDEG